MERQTKINPIDWDSIETVLLDMDGTILDLEFDNYFWLELVPKKYAKKHQLSEQESSAFLSAFYNKYHGTLNWYCTDFWSEKLKLDIIDLKNSVSERVNFRSGSINFLQQAKEQGKDLYLITNAHPDTLAIKLSKKDFSPYFKELLSSHITTYPKEDIRFWKSIEKRWNFDKNVSLFVDDSESILIKAKEFGIKHAVGISNPDSSKMAIQFENFISVNQLDELLEL